MGTIDQTAINPEQRAALLVAIEIAAATSQSVDSVMKGIATIMATYPIEKPVPESFYKTDHDSPRILDFGPFHSEPIPATYYGLLDKMRSIRDNKRDDYAAAEDEFRNFRQAEGVGVPAHIGAFVRLGDKYMRAQNLLGREWQLGSGPAVADESVEDTLLDLAIYSLLVYLIRQDWLSKGGPV